MNNINASITIIGAGSYGTALAIMFSRSGHNVILWGHNPNHIATLQANRFNIAILPIIPFPNSLYLESDLATALIASKNILIVVPSHVFSEILKKIKPLIRKDTRIAWATKGLEENTGRFLQDVAIEILGNNVPLAMISGPTFAKELAMGLPTAVSVVSTDIAFAKDLQNLIQYNKNFRAYISSDFIGVQLGGVIKNIIAIGVGILDGIGFGANARTVLITQGLNEMSHLGTKLGANFFTFIGIAGLGDLILTCTDHQSRNRRFGLMLGNGIEIQIAQEKIGQVVEGYRNTKEVRELARRFNVKMPIVEEIYQVLYCRKNINEAVLTLLK